MSKATNKYQWVEKVKPKAKALRHFKVEAVQKFNDQASELSRSQWYLTGCLIWGSIYTIYLTLNIIIHLIVKMIFGLK